MRDFLKIKYLLLVSILAFSCSNNNIKTGGNAIIKKNSSQVYYSCDMYPDLHYKKPGKCPNCGMKLTKKEISKSVIAQLHNETNVCITKPKIKTDCNEAVNW